MYPGFGSNFDAQTRRSYPSDDQHPLLAFSNLNNPDPESVFSEPSILPSPSTAAAGQSRRDYDYDSATSPSHVDNLPQSLSFSNQPLYPESFGTFLPPPVTGADQSHHDYPPATSHTNNLPPSSFSSQPPFPDPNIFANPSVTGDGPPMSFSNDPFRSDFFDSPTAQHRTFSSPPQDLRLPYWDDASNLAFAAYYDQIVQAQSPDLLSVDRITMLPPGGVDIPQRNGPLPFGVVLPPNEPRLENPRPVEHSLPLGDPLPTRQSGSRSRPIQFHPYSRSSQLKLRGVPMTKDIPDGGKSSQPKSSLLGPSLYDTDNPTHEIIFKRAKETLIRSALNDDPFLLEQERKQQALEALIIAASDVDKDHGKQWAMDNLGEFYRSTTAPSANIMSNCKKVARGLVQYAYGLRPSVWLRISEPQHQMETVENLIASFPAGFIFEKDDFDGQRAFENRAILDVVLNTIVDLEYSTYLIDLKSIFCTACAAIQCALQERSSGKFKAIGFVVPQFKPVYQSFKDYIETTIIADPELSARWEEYNVLIFDTLITIC